MSSGEGEVKKKGEKPVKAKKKAKLGARGEKTIAGVRRIIKMGGSYYVALPKEFLERHGLKEGDELPYVGNHVLKFVPVVEEEWDEEEG